MGWGYGYYSAPSAAKLRKQAEKRLAKIVKKDPGVQPIRIEGKAIAKTWWGAAWCGNLERYADYSNRIGRGRSYVKNGQVLDLRISEGLIAAVVSGRDIYNVAVKIDRLPAANRQGIAALCARRIDSVAALAEGRFPEEFGEIFMKQGDGLFPAPKEIRMSCDCPDRAGMCKHIAAALYGAGAKLDADPLLFFTLRGIDPSEFIKKSVDERMKNLLANAGRKSDRVIADDVAARIFKV
ncbi:MAG: hypothetical protein LBL66_03405 [Clostridiales bacterium]|jgi:uncharacterized Zn finger protein|nr:hypothetical protein [Clostridiales bacterium]